MASVIYGSGGVYGFQGFATKNYGSSAFVVFANNGVGYNFTLPSGFTLGSFSNTGSGFGPFLAGSWTSSTFAEVAANGSVYSSNLSGILPLPSGYPNCLTALGIPSGSVTYVFDSFGAVSSITSAGVVSPVTGSGIPVNLALRQGFPTYSGSTVFFPAGSGGIAAYNLTGTSSGSASLIPPPSGASTLTCCAISGNTLFVGGYGYSMFAPNAVASCYSSGTPSLLATFSPASNLIQVWTGATGLIGSSFGLAGQLAVTGLSSSLAGTFVSNNEFVLIDSGSGVFYDYMYAGGVISLRNSISSVTGTYPSVAFISPSAFVPQRSTSGLLAFTKNTTGFVSAGSGQTSAVSGANIGPIVACPSGFLGVACIGVQPQAIFSSINTSGSLFISNRLNIPTSITSWVVTTDASNFAPYTIQIYSASSGLLAGYISYTNQPAVTGFSYYGTNITNSGLVLGLAANGSLQFYTLEGNTISILDPQATQSQLSSLSLPVSSSSWVLNTGSSFVPVSGILNPQNLSFFNGCLLVNTTSGILELSMASPFSLTPVRAGVVATYNLATSSYTNISGLSQSVVPCTLGIDVSGNAIYSTLLGTAFQYSSGGALSNYQTIYSSGGGLINAVPSTTGFYGAAALAPAVIGFTA